MRDYLRTPRFNPLEMTGANKNLLAFNLSFLSQRADLLVPAMRQILAWLEQGRIKALPVQEFSVIDVAEAHRALESGQTVGKLILKF